MWFWIIKVSTEYCYFKMYKKNVFIVSRMLEQK